MSDSGKFQFEFNLGKVGIKKFNSLKEAQKWCVVEREHWNWLQEQDLIRQYPDVVGGINDAVGRFLTQIKNLLDNALNNNVVDPDQLINILKPSAKQVVPAMLCVYVRAKIVL